MKRIAFITGRPGVGKTSVLLRTVDELRKMGYNVAGMVSREVREHGSRIGFEILDLSTESKGWLAHVNQPTGPRIGKYRVNMEDFESIGINAILKALRDADVVVIDEIGPMELFSNKFREAVIKVVESEKFVIATIHYRLRNHFMNSLKRRKDAEIFEVTLENRSNLHKTIIGRALQFLRGK